MESKKWLTFYNMDAHPEGGFYKELYRSDNVFSPAEIGAERSYATSILFLLEENDVSHFHSIKSDELWYYHAGDACRIHMIGKDRKLQTVELGNDVAKGQLLQFCVPAGCIFASESTGKYSLVGCMVTPGFDFSDFKLYATKELLESYPKHENLIKKFTKEKY